MMFLWIAFVLRFFAPLGYCILRWLRVTVSTTVVSCMLAALFFLIALATASYIWAHSQNPASSPAPRPAPAQRNTWPKPSPHPLKA